MSAPLTLLDTNILVHLVRQKAAGRHLDAKHKLSSSTLRPLICVVTVGECMSLARQFGWGDNKVRDLQELLAQFPAVDINNPLIFQLYAEIDQSTRAGGTQMSKNDLWIAAAAASQNATLLTTDKDFLRVKSPRLHVVYEDPITLPSGP